MVFLGEHKRNDSLWQGMQRPTNKISVSIRSGSWNLNNGFICSSGTSTRGHGCRVGRVASKALIGDVHDVPKLNVATSV
jgi:hypothetical protein